MFKNVKKEQITIPAQMSYLTQVRDFIEHIGKKYRFHDKITNSFKLVVDEACTNIIRHGYRDIKNGEITIKAIIRRLSLTILIIDQGKSYDPRQANTPDLAKYVNIGKKGGLGILMMRKLMDDIQYSVTERGNEFRLTKNREASHESKAIKRWNDLNLKTKYSIIATLAFTVISSFVFTPIYIGVESDIRSEVLNNSSSGCQSLSDNIVDDLLDENTPLLFEKAYALRINNEKYIREVFIVDSLDKVLAWANTGHSYSFRTYQLPDDAVFSDTLGNISIYEYSPGDSNLIYDLHTDVLLGGEAVVGKVHVWVDQQAVQDMANSKKLRAVIVLLLVLVLGYVPLFYLIQRILSPFHSLADWVRQVVHGKVDQDEIDIDSSDEIGEIASAFNEMTTKFREAQVNLIEQQKLQKELQVAQEIQQMLLPSDFPKVEGYEIASYYEAAKEVGGDLFDFVEVDDDTIGICVADVSGKGVPGSLIMTMIRTALRLESRGNKNPADVLARVNRFVADDMKRGMFVTMFYIILDSRNREIHYASAGHNPMILYRGSTRQTYYLNPSGFPVGIQLPDLDLFARKIETDSIRLREDDILVLYTDGITEAMNSRRELFREERFLDSIRTNSHFDVGEFIKSINGDLKNFTGGAVQNDDITYVAIKEKLMPGEVIFKIQEELFRLIKSGVKVKDALERLRVSPHHYYKYKEIISRKGMDGLKGFLEDQDVVEKKHLSIELKTKIFDIIRKHPEYGPKLIAYALRTEAYGKVRIDPDRLYTELVKLKLNNEESRQRFANKEDVARFKLPGTPLLTLDGNVILNFESSEKEVAKRRGEDVDSPDATFNQKSYDKPAPRKINLSSDQPEEGKSPATYIHKQAKPFTPVTDMKPDAAGEKDKKSAADKTKPAAEKSKKKEAKASKPRKLVDEKKSLTKEEVLERIAVNIDQEKIAEFYQQAEDDFKTIRELLKNIEKSDNFGQDIKKINLVLKIIVKHPRLKELPDIQPVFEKMQQVFALIEFKSDQISKEKVAAETKDLLNYLEKDNKFKTSNKLFETINEIAMIHHRISQDGIDKDKTKDSNKINQIREKLAQKKIITDQKIFDPLTKDVE